MEDGASTTTATTGASAPRDLTGLIQITNEYELHEEEPPLPPAVGVAEEGGGVAQLVTNCPFPGAPGFCPVGGGAGKDDGGTGNDDHDGNENGCWPRPCGCPTAGAEGFASGMVSGAETAGRESLSVLALASGGALEGARWHSARAAEALGAAGRGVFEASVASVEGARETAWACEGSLRSLAFCLWEQRALPLWEGAVPYLAGTGEGWSGEAGAAGCLLEGTLRAFGRVVFCDNPVTGLFCLAGILWASPLAGLCSLLSALSANAVALFWNEDQGTLRSGRCATNAVLTGSWIAGSVDPGFSDSATKIVLFLAVAVLAPATLWIERCWSKRWGGLLPPLLLPANAVVVATVLCAGVWNRAMDTRVELCHRGCIGSFGGAGSGADDINDDDDERLPTPGLLVHEVVLHSLSGIFFAENPRNPGSFATGALVLIGVLCCSRVLALALAGGAAASGLGLGRLVFGASGQALDGGDVFGVNPALAAAGILYYYGSRGRNPPRKTLGLAVLAAFAAVVVQSAFDAILELLLDDPVATSLGFCFTLLPLLSSSSSVFQRIPEPELSTPEDHGLCLNLCNQKSKEDDDDDDDDDEAGGSSLLGDSGRGSGIAKKGSDGSDDDYENIEAPPANEKTPLLDSP